MTTTETKPSSDTAAQPTADAVPVNRLEDLIPKPAAPPIAAFRPTAVPEVALHLGITNNGSGKMEMGYFRSFLDATLGGCFNGTTIIGDSHPDRCRNTVVHEFLKTEATHLLFVDLDIVYTRADVKRLLEHFARGVDVVAGCYAKKQKGPASWVVNAKPDEKVDPATGLLKVAKAGTGFIGISRRVFNQMAARYAAEMEFISDGNEAKTLETRYAYFASGVVRRRWLSEDWLFSERCWEMGIPVYLDTKIQVQHVGSIPFPLEPMKDPWP